MSSSSRYILGCGGHTRSLIPVLKILGVSMKGIFDNNYIDGENVMSVPLIGSLKDISTNHILILSSGNPGTRSKHASTFTNIDLENYLSKTSNIEEGVILKGGVHVMNNVFINALAKIDKHVLINTNALIEHEVEIGAYSHIAVGAIICGRVKIGKQCFIGAGSVVKDGISITDNVTIGAGAVVVNSISESGVYVGNPAKKIK